MANNQIMRKLFLKLYFKMFITMLLLATIGVLAFYTLNQRQQQMFLQQHTQLLITQIQSYFEEKLIFENVDTQTATFTADQISNELILFQQFSGIYLTPVDSKNDALIMLYPKQQVNATFALFNGVYHVHWPFDFDQQSWLIQVASIVRERIRLKSIDNLNETSSLFVDSKGMSFSTEIFETINYTDHQIQLLISDLPIFQRYSKSEDTISTVLLLNNRTILKVTSSSFDETPSLAILIYTLLIVMFIGLFISILFIKPIEKKFANLLKILDKTEKKVDDRLMSITIHSTLSAPKNEIDEISLKVTQMMQRMHQLSKDQQEMTRAISHEFRTPIVKMGYHVELLQDFVAHDDFSITGIKQNMKELHGLVDELLLYSSLEHSVEVVFKLFDLKSSIIVLIEQLQVLSPCRLILKMDQSINIKAHESYLIRALQNLITNAQRYGKDKILIVVKQINRQVHITVEDDGVGLTQEQNKTVFEPFQVIEKSRNKKLAGHGLGLAIVKRIVLLHGGKAFVGEPIELSGASFVLVFPIRSL